MRKKILLAACILVLFAACSSVSVFAVGNYGADTDSDNYHADSLYWQYEGECTWYVWGRAHEKWGASIPWLAHAKDWAYSAQNEGWPVDTVPKAGSIAVWTTGDHGHVAYVENVDGEVIYLSESNYNYDHKYFETKQNLGTGHTEGTFRVNPVNWYRTAPDYYIHIVSDVSFDANGGNGAPAKQDKVAGNSLQITTSVPTRSGHKFVCWNSSPDGSGAITVNPGDCCTSGILDS